MADKKLLDVKANLKKRQPAFKRSDSHKIKRIGSNWRKPRGLHNKIGDNRRGYRKGLKGGYQTPVALRGRTKDGLLPISVTAETQLAELDNKDHVIIVDANLGGKKKVVIIEAALKAGFKLLNASKERAEQLTDKFKKQSADKKAREKAREEKSKAREKEAEKKEKEGEKESSDDKPAEKPVAKEPAKKEEKPAPKAESKPKPAPKPVAEKKEN